MKLSRLVALVLCFSLMASSIGFVNASERSIDIAQRKQEAAESYLIEMEKYLSVDSEGLLYLEPPKRYTRNEYYPTALDSLDATNSMIKSGYLTADKDGNISVTDKYIEYVRDSYSKVVDSKGFTVEGEGSTITITDGSKASGVNKIVWSGLRFKLYLDSSNANKVAAGGGAAAGVLAIWFPEPFVAKILATVLLVYSGAIAASNSNGTGVIISGFLILGPPTSFIIYWVKSQ